MLDLNFKPRSRKSREYTKLGDHAEVYSLRRHFRQWWTGYRGSHARWLTVRAVLSLVTAYPVWIFIALGAVPTHAAAHPRVADIGSVTTHAVMPASMPDLAFPIQSTSVQRRGRVKPHRLEANGTITGPRGGTVTGARGGIMRILSATEIAFRYNGQRAWYEGNRPQPAGVLRNRYVNLGTTGTGDGSIGNPYTADQTSTLGSPLAGDRFYIWGNYTGYLLVNAGNGTADNWVQYVVRPGFSCTVDSSATQFQPPMTLASREYMWLQGITFVQRKAPSSNPPDYCIDCRTTTHVAVVDCIANGKLEGAYSPQSAWYEGNTINMGITQVLAPEENAGDCITIASPGFGDGHVIYRNTLSNPGHAALSFSGGGPTTDWNTNGRVGFNDVTAPWCAGIVMSQCIDCVVECNTIHDCGTQPTSVALSMESVQVGGIRCIGRYNIIYNFGSFGILLIAGQFGGYSQHVIDCEVYHNVMWNGLGLPLFINCRDLVADLEFSGTKVYNNLAWDYHNWTLTGDATTDYGRGYFETKWYDIIVQAPSSNPTSPAYVTWIGGGHRTIGTNEIRNNMFGSSRHTGGGTRFMLYVSGILVNGAYTNEAAAKADALSSSLSGHVQDTDPQFVSTTVGNASFLAIPSGSAAKDAGRVISGVSYNGTGPDIGVYEV